MFNLLIHGSAIPAGWEALKKNRKSKDAWFLEIEFLIRDGVDGWCEQRIYLIQLF
jgi:hypothetical protein